jgi:hypothetical protein
MSPPYRMFGGNHVIPIVLHYPRFGKRWAAGLADRLIDRPVRILPQAANGSAGLPTLSPLDSLDSRTVAISRRPPNGSRLVAAIGPARLDDALLRPFTLRALRRRFRPRSIAVVLGALGAATTAVRGIVTILDRKHGTCRAREEDQKKELTHGHYLGNVTTNGAPMQMSGGLTVSPANPLLQSLTLPFTSPAWAASKRRLGKSAP